MASSHRPSFYRRRRYFGSYRIWLYGYNIVLIISLCTFVAVTCKILHNDRMYLFPLGHKEPLILYLFFGPLLQLLDIFIGLLGIWRQRTILLTCYWWFLLVILLCDFLIGISWIFRWRALHATSGEYFLNLLSNEHNSPKFCRLWNDVQSELKCCGVYSVFDWQSVGNFCLEHLTNGSTEGSRLPRSCCEHSSISSQMSTFCPSDESSTSIVDSAERSVKRLQYPDSTASPPSSSLPLARGCRDALIKWLYHQSNVVFLLGICVVVFLKVVGLVITRTEIRQLGEEIFARENRNAILAQSRFSVDMSPFMNPANRRHTAELVPLSTLNGNCGKSNRKRDSVRLMGEDQG